jgi:hypothetical protein
VGNATSVRLEDRLFERAKVQSAQAVASLQLEVAAEVVVNQQPLIKPINMATKRDKTSIP